MKTFKKILSDIAIIVCIGIIAYCGYNIYKEWKKVNTADKNDKKIAEIVQKPEKEKQEEQAPWVPTADTYNQMYQENNDYVGWMLFDSRIISEPVFKGATNDTYLRSDMDGNYDEFGQVFIDAQSSIDDTNVMVYGHSYAGKLNDTHRFSPLQNMTNQDYADANSTFSFYTKDKIINYRIIYASVVDTSTDPWTYSQSRFASDSDKAAWIEDARKRSAINRNDISIDVSTASFMTMQTCVDFNSSRRYIITAEKVSETNYS